MSRSTLVDSLVPANPAVPVPDHADNATHSDKVWQAGPPYWYSATHTNDPYFMKEGVTLPTKDWHFRITMSTFLTFEALLDNPPYVVTGDRLATGATEYQADLPELAHLAEMEPDDGAVPYQDRFAGDVAVWQPPRTTDSGPGATPRIQTWGVPLLVMEAESEASRRADRQVKHQIYARMGVTEYWRCFTPDDVNTVITAYHLVDTGYREIPQDVGGAFISILFQTAIRAAGPSLEIWDGKSQVWTTFETMVRAEGQAEGMDQGQLEAMLETAALFLDDEHVTQYRELFGPLPASAIPRSADLTRVTMGLSRSEGQAAVIQLLDSAAQHRDK